MADIGGLLTQKIGPFPGFVWALGVGGLVFLLGPKLLKGGSTATGPQPGAFDPQSFEAGFAQGAMYQPGGAPGASVTPPSSADTGVSPVQRYPCSSMLLQPHPARLPQQGVGGAAGRNRSASIGSISADPHAYWHPAMKQQPRYPHFVRAGVGGATGGAPIAHAAAVHQLAHQAEIHPARLQMLIPRSHRFVRVA